MTWVALITSMYYLKVAGKGRAGGQPGATCCRGYASENLLLQAPRHRLPIGAEAAGAATVCELYRGTENALHGSSRGVPSTQGRHAISSAPASDIKVVNGSQYMSNRGSSIARGA